MIAITILQFLKETFSNLTMPVDSIPGWVTFCGNTAPFAAIVVFLAVSPRTTISEPMGK